MLNFTWTLCYWKAVMSKKFPQLLCILGNSLLQITTHPYVTQRRQMGAPLFTYDNARHRSCKFSFFASQMIDWTACPHWSTETKSFINQTLVKFLFFLQVREFWSILSLSLIQSLLRVGWLQSKTFSDLFSSHTTLLSHFPTPGSFQSCLILPITGKLCLNLEMLADLMVRVFSLFQ